MSEAYIECPCVYVNILTQDVDEPATESTQCKQIAKAKVFVDHLLESKIYLSLVLIDCSASRDWGKKRVRDTIPRNQYVW